MIDDECHIANTQGLPTLAYEVERTLGREENDEQRQKALKEAGFTVLRFTNEEVLTNIQWTHSYLKEWIEKKLGSFANQVEQPIRKTA